MNKCLNKILITIFLFYFSLYINTNVKADENKLVNVTLKQGNPYEIGSIYEIKTEQKTTTWYVIKSTDKNLKLLSQYNLKASNYLTQDTTGADNKVVFDGQNARNNDNNTYCKDTSKTKGCSAYAKGTGTGPNGEANWYTNGSLEGTVTEDSAIKKKVDNFVNSLNLEENLVSSGLITGDDLKELGCNSQSYSLSCSTAYYSWVYSTSYWTVKVNSGQINQVYFVNKGGKAGNTDPKYSGAGIRPVITIKKSIIMHEITTEVIGQGNIELNKYSAKQGDLIEITISPEEGYKLESIIAKYGDETNIEINNNTFLMPNEDVVVTAKFKEIEKEIIIDKENNNTLNNKTEKNPSTGDNINFYIILASISFIVLTTIVILILKKNKKDQ